MTWDDVLWAAVTVGRSNRHYVFQHGNASLYEALFRWSLVRMALEQAGSSGRRLRRTNAARTLDPTEKGAINYFLGMTFCKLFASKLLNTPWLLHLDVFRSKLNAVLMRRSRPDLVGQENGTNRWHAFECKGRISPPDLRVKAKAKAQAQQVVTVDGTPCTLHIGSITYLRNDVLNFFWRDPPTKEGAAFEVPFTVDAWRYYYSLIVGTIGEPGLRTVIQGGASALVPVDGLDLGIGIHPAVARHLLNEHWGAAQNAAAEAASEIAAAGYQPDGLLVKAGDSWRERFEGPSIAQQ